MPRPPRRGEPQAQRHHIPDRRAGAARRRGRRCGGEGRRSAGPAARRAGQHQGEYRPEGPADAQRRGRLQGRDRARGLTRRRRTGARPAPSSSAAPMRRLIRCAGTPTTRCAAAPTTRGPRGARRAAPPAAPARRSPPASGRSRTATTMAGRSASRPIAAASPASGRPMGASPAFNPSAQAERPPTIPDVLGAGSPRPPRQGCAAWPQCHERARCARPVVGARASSRPLAATADQGRAHHRSALRPSEDRGSGAQSRRHPEQCRLRGGGSDAAVDRGRARTVGEAGRGRHPRDAVGDHRGQRRSAWRQGSKAVARRACRRSPWANT